MVIAQLCLALWDPMDCSSPGSSVHGILQARLLEWVYHSLFQRIFPTQGLNLGLPHYRQTLYRLSHRVLRGDSAKFHKCECRDCDRCHGSQAPGFQGPEKSHGGQNRLLRWGCAKSLQSCPTLCDPIDGRQPGSPVPGILQARTLEWVAISFSNAWKWKWSRSVVFDS